MATSTIIFANNASTTLAGSITSTALTANLAPGTGVEFPTPAAGQYFVGTFRDAATGLINEIVWVTGRSGDTITMVRAQEGTVAEAWTAGDLFGNLWTAGQAATMLQAVQGQAQAGNYAADTGVVNAYVCALSPTVSTIVPGMPIRVKIGNTNTGASTLDDGAGPLPIVNPDGTAIGSSTLQANGIYEFIPDGAGHHQLVSASGAALSSSGIATTGDMKCRPTTETIAGWVIANATTIGNAASNATQLANSTTSALFAWTWTNFSNTQCPIFTSGGVPSTRGASAAADYAANKQITVVDWRGVGPMGIDTMGGGATTLLTGVPVVSGSTTTPGSVLGENTHVLTSPTEIPAHLHGVVDPGHSHGAATGTDSPPHNHNFNQPQTGTVTSLTSSSPVWAQATTTVVTGNPNSLHSHSISSGTTGISTSNTGSGGAHNTVQRSVGVYWYVKL